jgi:AcrR family transcriptional regulator
LATARRPKAARRGKPGALRREPTQERGKARVEAILDAAEIVFAEAGYDLATTEAIAAKAGASIGSLYQFFPNKRALFDAISRRHLDRVKALFDGVVPTAIASGASWEDLLDGAIDAFWALTSGHPGFAAVWLQGRLTKELLSAGFAANRAFAERAEQLIEVFAPSLPRDRRRVVASVVVECVSWMLFHAARSGAAAAPAIVRETKAMLRAYLREVVASVGSPAPT